MEEAVRKTAHMRQAYLQLPVKAMDHKFDRTKYQRFAGFGEQLNTPRRASQIQQAVCEEALPIRARFLDRQRLQVIGGGGC